MCSTSFTSAHVLVEKPVSTFPEHALLRWRISFFGKPASTFPGHALLRWRMSFFGKPASTFPGHALAPVCSKRQSFLSVNLFWRPPIRISCLSAA
jgi:hypothetical protein